LAFGFWLLAFGFWLLAFGFWLLAFGRLKLNRKSLVFYIKSQPSNIKHRKVKHQP
jgi:hypothetical protein